MESFKIFDWVVSSESFKTMTTHSKSKMPPDWLF